MPEKVDLARQVKALAGRLFVQGRLLASGASPLGLGRVWAYTDDCAGIPRHRPPDSRQGCKHVLPDLAAAPWRAAEDFAWTGAVTGAVAAIRTETSRLHGGDGFGDDGGDMIDPSWRVHWLWCLGEPIGGGRGCAATEAAVAAVPRIASTGLCYLATLPAGATTPLGCGTTNTRLRFTLGLEVPDGCALEVAGEARRWREAEWLVFEDSFLHRAWNRAERALTILVIDVWHPGITDREALALERFMQLSPESVRRRRNARERLGRRG